MESGAIGVAEALLQAGVPVDVCDDNQASALRLASERGHAAMVELLVSWGAEASSLDAGLAGSLAALQPGRLRRRQPTARDNWADLRARSTARNVHPTR